ncbi:L,D-transpeptidase [Sedimentimonas flavescens]|uniref:L,D-transpeptidase n=1 Tax=Sedimentimonas flavescens TaxID=2851012 RepID=UPI002E2CE389|nr:L,D-transpeptidase [Sedimentimonas flavescens]
MIRSFARSLRPLALLMAVVGLAACGAPNTSGTTLSSAGVPPEYRARQDGERVIPAVNPAYLNERNRRRWVAYNGPEEPGTFVVDPFARLLYHVVEPGKAMRFGIAVGKEGRGFRGDAVIRRKEEYPSWTPTKNMIRQDPEIYGPLAGGLPGGLDNPLGARALYLYRGGRDTMYRIHGTMDPSSIGKATSAGCIRLFNQDIIDMYDEMELGTKVRVRSYEESLEMEGPMVELHSGYLVSASDTAAIAADQAAWEAGLIVDPALTEAQAHAAAAAAAEAQASGVEAEPYLLTLSSIDARERQLQGLD